MSPYRPIRRVDLFLVRVWREDIDDVQYNADSSGAIGSDNSGGGKAEWRGNVQRVVDGESHQFSGWQGLTDLLLAMISNKQGR
jgi:hypothetical protein